MDYGSSSEYGEKWIDGGGVVFRNNYICLLIECVGWGESYWLGEWFEDAGVEVVLDGWGGGSEGLGGICWVWGFSLRRGV